MIRADAAFADAVEAIVAQVEDGTDAEIVVVVAERSDPWSTRPWAFATAAALLAGAALELAPFAVTPWQWLLEISLVGAVVRWALARPAIAPRLVPRAIRRARVEEAARAAFVDEAVHGTRHRIGVLVYVSLAEEEVAVLPDLGVHGRVPGGALTPVVRRMQGGGSEAFLTGLRALGEVLATHLPDTGGDDPGLANRPRFR